MVHGHGLVKYQSGASYEGEWDQGKYHGEGKYVWADGSWYEGGWHQDKCVRAACASLRAASSAATAQTPLSPLLRGLSTWDYVRGVACIPCTGVCAHASCLV